MLYKATAPGSLMLMGEHAVLHEEPALVLAVNKPITVCLQPKNNANIVIESNLGSLTFDVKALSAMALTPPFQFVLACLQYYQTRINQRINQGFSLTIESQFSEKMGLGSSAAVVVATVFVLEQWLGELEENDSKDKKNKDQAFKKNIFDIAYSIILKVQGVGSGADVAASIYGGILYYQKDPVIIEPLPESLPLIAIYSGSKVLTAEVINQVKQNFHHHPMLMKNMFTLMGQCVQDAKQKILEKDWLNLGKLMNVSHGLLHALGVSNTILDSLVHSLNAKPNIYGAKISGAGLGDCVIGLGSLDREKFQCQINNHAHDFTPFIVEPCLQGARYHE